MLKQILTNTKSPLLSLFRYEFGILKFKLPDLGQKIKQGTIKKLYVKQGDHVKQFQKLADVSSDKQFTEITASDQGIIRKIYHKEEEQCQVGQLFFQIQVKDMGGYGNEENIKEEKAVVQRKEGKIGVEREEDGEQILASPYVRGLIKEKKLDIRAIRGTGQNRRITEADIEKYLSDQQSKIQEKETKMQKQDQVHIHAETKHYGHKLIKMNNFQRGMQKSMTQTNKIPHLYLHQQFDLTETQKMRKTIKVTQKKVTLMGILVKTFSLALKKYQIMNATYEPQKNQFEYIIHNSHNISIAIDSPNGLVVPNVKNVEGLSILEIQQQLERLRNLAKDAHLTHKQLNGGTICLSNIGTIGGVNACPLILPPQICIVAIGKMQTIPKYYKEQLQPRNVVTVSYGCDHRVIDGATVARFSNEWKKVIENPYLALVEMN